jgi:4Fe-4S single cluster domain
MTLIPTLSMQVTYQCNITCKHCGPYCSPKEADWMSGDEMRSLITQAAELEAGSVVFTGGEPSLLGKDLPPLIRFVHERGIKNTRVVSNAKFASTQDKATRVLGSWQEAGLCEVNFSCGEYHQEFVPIEHVANAYRAACDLGFKTVLLAGNFLAPGRGKLDRDAFEAAVGRPLLDVQELSPYSEYSHGMSVSESMPYGRGREFVKPGDITFHPVDKLPSCCDHLLVGITAHPNGNMTACCGIMVRQESLLNIGNWRRQPLREIVTRAHEDFVLNWIKYRGLREMKTWLEARDPELKFRESYQNICDLCAEIVYNPRAQALLAKGDEEKRKQIIASKVVTDAVLNAPNFRYEAGHDPLGPPHAESH